MLYNDYILLGFKRINLNDEVEFKQTGYYGYCLEKKVNSEISISVNSGELDKPRLYIKKRNEDAYHIYVISPECVKDMLYKKYKFKIGIGA